MKSVDVNGVQRVGVALALVLAVAAATAASPARAAEPPPRQTRDLLGGLQGTLTGVLGTLTGAVQGVACPVGGAVPVVEQLACNLDLLHVRFATRFKRADGSILGETYGGTLFVPTLLDVNGDGVADVVATASIASLTSAKLSITKLPTAPATLPASIEAVIADPTKGSLPRKVIAYGEDALASSLPQSFASTVTFGTIASEPGGVQIDVQNTVDGSGGSLAVLAGLFNGTPDARVDQMGGSMRYTPVPSKFGASVRMGDRFTGTLTTISPTTLGLAFSTTEGAEVQRFDGTIDKLPASATVGFEKAGEDQRTVTFSGSAPIATVDGTYASGTKDGAGAFTVAEHAEAHVTGMPTRLKVQQTSAKQATLSTEGSGPIGQARVGLANGTPRFLDTAESYARTFEEGAFKSIAAQVNGLRTASFDGREKIVLDATFAAVAPEISGFRIRTDDDARHVDGHVSDVPDHITATIDLEGGVIDYDGHGQSVAAIDLDATRTTAFFERATHIHGSVRKLPASVRLDFKPGARSADFKASAPIGEVDLVASAGAAAGIPGTGAGALYLNRRDAFVVAGRIKGLKRVLLQGGDTYATEIEISPGDFSLDYDDGARVLDGDIKGLPGKLAGSYDPAKGAEYHASGVIPEIRMDLTSSAPFADRLRSASTTLTGVPKDIVVTQAPAGGGDPGSICRDSCNLSTGYRVTATPPITQIEAAVSSNPSPPQVPGTDSGVVVTSTPAELSAAVRVKGIQEVTVKGEPVAVNVKAAAGQRFTIAARFNEAGDAFAQDTTVDGFIEDIPATVDVSMVGKVLHYKASAPIARIFLSAEALPDTISKAKVDIRVVPTELYVYAGEDKDGNADVYGVDALGQTIGQIDLNLSDFHLEPDLTGRTTSQVALDTYERIADPDGVLKLRTRIFDLRKAILRKGGAGEQIIEAGFAGTRPLTLDIRTGETALLQSNVTIHTPPASLVTTLDTNEKTFIGLLASEPIGSVDADVRNGPDGFASGGLDAKSIFTSNLRNVPSDLRFCLTEKYPRCGGNFPTYGNAQSVNSQFALDVKNNGPAPGQPGAMEIDARLCLGLLAGITIYSPAGCRNDAHAFKYLDLRNVRLKDFHMEIANGFHGETGDTATYLGTTGVLVDRLRFVDPSIDTDFHGVELRQPTDPIVFGGFFFVVDTENYGPDFPGIEGPFGFADCPASTVLNLVHRESDGTIKHVGVSHPNGPIFDFSGFVGC